MTKKFWKDWQNRIGETKNIELSSFITNKNNGRTYYHSVLSNIYGEDKILKASFNGNTVDLVIERHGWGNGHHTVENEYLTLHRNEIETIVFINYWK